MTIAQVNALDRNAFIEQVGWVFEHSPWIAERMWGLRPFADVQSLHRTMALKMSEASEAEQLKLLQAHPDLGARAKMSAASVGEQAGAGLDQLTQAEFDELHSLNSSYKQKHGFPFLYAVKGSTKHDILTALRERLERSRSDEFQEALNQVTRMARFRLESLIDGTVS